MREYGQVQSTFWQSSDAQTFSDRAKLLALYLLTGPHTNGIGCFTLPDGYVMADLAWTQEMVSEGFVELSRYGFAYRIDRVVFIPKFMRWNAIQNPKVAISRVAELVGLPDGEAKTRAARAMLEFGRHLSDAQTNLIDTVCHTISKLEPTLPNPNQNQPRAEEREKPRKPNGTKSANPVTDLPAPQPRRRPQVEFETWLDSLPADELPVKPDDPIFGYADDTGIPADFIELAWVRFGEEMRIKRKRQRDWRAHFRNAVRSNWFKLWWFDNADAGRCKLTTVGEQARRAFEAERRSVA